MKKIRLILADDHLLIRAGIRALLDPTPDITVIAECADGLQTLKAVREFHPDILLLDIAMPGADGIEVARQLHTDAPETRILILSSIERPETVAMALSTGISGYLLKDFVLDELQQALRTVMAGKPYLSPKIHDIVTNTLQQPNSEKPRLTPRQTEILRLVASGASTKQIARDLGISPKTVEFHRSQLMERIGVRDVAGLTRYALQRGLLE